MRLLRTVRFAKIFLLELLLVSLVSGVFFTTEAFADITCYDFSSQAEAQQILDALPNDPYGLDSGWPPPDLLGGGDGEAGNGVACDAENVIRELKSPGDEKYTINADSSKNGKNSLPESVEQATVQSYVEGAGIQTVENPEKIYTIMSVATPEYEPFANYEVDDVPGQCGAMATTLRLQELLTPGTTIWLEVDEAGFYTQTMLDRHVWIQIDGRYRLISEILITEGRGVTATERPGTGRANAAEAPPPGSRYRDILRRAQTRAIDSHVGIWSECQTS